MTGESNEHSAKLLYQPSTEMVERVRTKYFLVRIDVKLNSKNIYPNLSST